MSRHQKNLSPITNKPDLLSGVEQLCFEDFKEHLKDKGLYNERDLLAALLHEVLKFKGMFPKESQELKKNKERLFGYKYHLKQEQVDLLKLLAQGYKYKEIPEKLGIAISEEGMNKRIGKLYSVLSIHSRHEAARIAFKEGIV